MFYLRSEQSLHGQYDVGNLYVNVVFAIVVAGVVGWALHTGLHSKLRARFSRAALASSGILAATLAGVYTGFILTFTDKLHVILGPAVGALAAIAAGWALYKGCRRISAAAAAPVFVLAIASAASVLGAYCGYLVVNEPGSGLYLSWGVSCLLAGTVGLALYRGLYINMRERAKSPLVMLVASLGILLAISAFISIVFESAPRPLPEAFGSSPWTIGGANIKGFNLFAIGVAIAGFAGLLALLKYTSLGRAIRAIGDDEEVAKVVGINTTVVIAIVFFIGAVYAALAGVLSGHDTAIQPRMGLLLLLKGWIASVVGGIGNLQGGHRRRLCPGVGGTVRHLGLGRRVERRYIFRTPDPVPVFLAEGPFCPGSDGMLRGAPANSYLRRLAGIPRGLAPSGKFNLELWANLIIISWAVGFMLWQGVGFAITVGTVFAIWAILAVSLNLVVGFTGTAVYRAHRLLRHRSLCRGHPHVGHRLRTAAHGSNPNFRLAVLRGAARGHGVSRPGGRRCGSRVQPVQGRHLRAGVLWLHHQ